MTDRSSMTPTATDHIPVPLVLAIALPGGTWHVEHITLWFTPPPPTDRDQLEAEAIAAWVGTHPRTDAVHLWLMEDEVADRGRAAAGAANGWEEDEAVTELRERRRGDTLGPDDFPF